MIHAVINVIGQQYENVRRPFTHEPFAVTKHCSYSHLPFNNVHSKITTCRIPNISFSTLSLCSCSNNVIVCIYLYSSSDCYKITWKAWFLICFPISRPSSSTYTVFGTVFVSDNGWQCSLLFEKHQPIICHWFTVTSLYICIYVCLCVVILYICVALL